jgi:hypothetical protein
MGAPGPAAVIYLKVPPYLGELAAAVVAGAAVPAGAEDTGALAAGLVAAAVVVTAVWGALVVVAGTDVEDVVVAGEELQPAKTRIETNKTTMGMNNLFK